MPSTGGSGEKPDNRPEGHSRADERRRIARELHDGTSQLLTLMQLTLGRLKRAGGGEAAALVEECEKSIQEIREHIRSISRD